MGGADSLCWTGLLRGVPRRSRAVNLTIRGFLDLDSDEWHDGFVSATTPGLVRAAFARPSGTHVSRLLHRVEKRASHQSRTREASRLPRFRARGVAAEIG